MLQTIGHWLVRLTAKALRTNQGNVAMMFALAAVPLLGAIGAGVDFAGATKSQVAMQTAVDEAALALVKQGGSLSSNSVQSMAQSWFNAAFKENDLSNVSVTASYNASTSSATVGGTGSYTTALLKLVGLPTLNVSSTATATLAPKNWPICVEVTASASNHTLITMGTGGITFDKCLVQVNTNNWDAVEARNTSSIASTNGDNCFVGDIHYGNVTPAKDPSCSFFPDPFANYAMPASAANCDYTSKAVTVAGTTLSPGTYCNGLVITASTTLSPGVYIIKNGDLKISGSSTAVNGNGVVFLFTGTNTPGFAITNNATVNLTPATQAVAGQFGGFVFYFDQGSANPCVDPNDGSKLPGLETKTSSSNCISQIDSGANVTLSGIVYMQSQAFIVDGGTLTVNPGSMVADLIATNGSGKMSLTGTLNTSTSAQIAMQKTGTGSNPVLTR